MLKEYSILFAFILGILHVLEPCEDKAIVSLYVAWVGKNWKQTLRLILLYGFGMLLINVLIGFLASFIGVNYLQGWQSYFNIGAGIFTIIFGLLIIYHSHLFVKFCFLEHNRHTPDIADEKSILLFGLLRGLPLCPVEVAVMFWAASIGNLFKGILLVAAFSFGTILSLVPYGLGAKGIFNFINNRAGEKVKKGIQLGIGIIVVIAGIITLFIG